MPPSALKRFCIASARLPVVLKSAAKEARKMWRASSSIERLLCAACMRNLAFVDSSSFRMVILAIGFLYAINAIIVINDVKIRQINLHHDEDNDGLLSP
jgi:hypothetical protein